MTTSLETIRRLHAWKEGRPIPRGEVVNVHVTDDENLMIAAFLRMGGESRPWGVALGTLVDGPSFFTVPDGRNRQLVGDMMVEVGRALLAHFRHPDWSDEAPTRDPADFRQIWLPGATHVEMLQCLAAAYARTRWEREDVGTLRSLGNLCNALFMEHHRPGQQTVISATAALRTCYVFPTAPVRQGHLGHLLGWLSPGRGRNARLETALAAERQSMATVIDPDEERSILEPLVTQWGDARRRSDAKGLGTNERSIAAHLERHLRARWEATAAAAGQIDGDEREYNDGLLPLVDDSASQMYWNWGAKAHTESLGSPVYWPDPFTDRNARSVGGAFQRRIGQEEKARHHLVHGDRELQREELAAGHGVIGTIVSVDPTTPRWTVKWRYPALPTLREGNTVSIAGWPDSALGIVDVDLDGALLTVEPKWKTARGGKGLDAPTERTWKGRHVVLLPSSVSWLAERKAKTALKDFGPDDITVLLDDPPTRHGAFDDDGLVLDPPATSDPVSAIRSIEVGS